jgi:hypothetical protein
VSTDQRVTVELLTGTFQQAVTEQAVLVHLNDESGRIIAVDDVGHTYNCGSTPPGTLPARSVLAAGPRPMSGRHGAETRLGDGRTASPPETTHEGDPTPRPVNPGRRGGGRGELPEDLAA